MQPNPSRRQLVEMLDDARRWTVALVDDLDEDQRMGPKLDIINPYLWEIGHVAWFHERWILRHLDERPPLHEDADELYDSIAIDHDNRWDLPLPSYEETRAYMEAVRRDLEERLEGREPTEEERYYYRYTTFHEDMHTEAFTYTRQTLGYAPPELAGAAPPPQPDGGDLDEDEDVDIPGGTFVLGAPPDAPFAFDNEKKAHEVELEPFQISRTAVTNRQFAEFVEDGGYQHRDLWSDEGWEWRQREGATKPNYWRREGDTWMRRLFDRWVPLRPELPVVHVSYWEAEAWCNWAGRRLPTEAEWEAAAAGIPEGSGFAREKRRYPWGEAPNSTPLAHWDGVNLGEAADGSRELVPVDAFPEGESAFGCRQMLGNVWEWTASTFEPYPGFEPDMYREYSEPWFGDRMVLRGGAWITRSRMVHNMWRNYFPPARRDVYAGFRTCAERT